nr:hypothetical protein [Acinetobacter junii]
MAANITSSSFRSYLCGIWWDIYFTALLWLRYVDQVMLSRWDVLGVLIVLCGAAIIILQPQGLVR